MTDWGHPMGLDDLVDDVEEGEKEEEVEELADELDVDDKEELEKQEGRVSELYEMLIQMDKRLSDMEDELSLMRYALIKALDDEELKETKWEQIRDE
jgi:hypothetical protein